MKTLKKSWTISSLMIFLACNMIMISCSDDDKESTFSGYYAGDFIFSWIEEGIDDYGEPGVTSGYCFHFVNDNTVEVVNFNVSLNSSSKSFYNKSYQGVTYYFIETSRKTYTYTIKEGKIYITNGTIGTVNGNEIIEDGGDRLIKFK